MSNRISVWEGYGSDFGRYGRRKKCRYGRKKNGRHGCLKHPRKRR